MSSGFNLAQFWQQGDFVSHAVAIVLMLLSITSWTVIVAKLAAQLRLNRSAVKAIATFWEAETLAGALAAMQRDDRTGVFADLARAGIQAADLHQRHAARGIGAGVSVSEFVTRALRSRIVAAQAGIEVGLTFLASTGSTAPFIGLFGTVWGIYHALAGLAGASTVVLDKVAGPVGEALIMTAAGLFVAIPAVLAYNTLTRGNRLILAHLDGFAHDLHAFLTTGVRLSPETGRATRRQDFSTPASAAA